MRASKEEQRRFLEEAWPAAMLVASQTGADPDWLVDEAAKRSCYGLEALHYNIFMKEGSGPYGSARVIRGFAEPTGMTYDEYHLPKYPSMYEAMMDFLGVDP